MWSEPLAVLETVGSAYSKVFFILFLAFWLFFFCNLITSVFVGRAMQTLGEEQDATIVRCIDAIFTAAELKTGDITWSEFNSMMNLPEMGELFKSINIDVSEARNLFHLLDADNVGILDHTELIDGCLRLRGPAKSLELSLLMVETNRMNQWSVKKMHHIESQIKSVLDRIGSLQGEEAHEPEEHGEDEDAMTGLPSVSVGKGGMVTYLPGANHEDTDKASELYPTA